MVCPFWECCWYFDQASLIWLFHFIHILLHMYASYFLCRNLKGIEVSFSLILLIPITCKMKSILFNMVYGLSNQFPSDFNATGLARHFKKHCIYLFLKTKLNWSPNSFLTVDILNCFFLYVFMLLSVILQFCWLFVGVLVTLLSSLLKG